MQIKEADKAAMLEAINTNESASAHKDFLPRANKISYQGKRRFHAEKIKISCQEKKGTVENRKQV